MPLPAASHTNHRLVPEIRSAPLLCFSRPPACPPACRRPERSVAFAAALLAQDSVDGLTLDQHLALLRYLCDTALESERMRGILQREPCCCRRRRRRLACTVGFVVFCPRHFAPISASLTCGCCLPLPAAGREDEAVDAKRDVREEVAEQRKQLKEILDAGGCWVQKGVSGVRVVGAASHGRLLISLASFASSPQCGLLLLPSPLLPCREGGAQAEA